MLEFKMAWSQPPILWRNILGGGGADTKFEAAGTRLYRIVTLVTSPKSTLGGWWQPASASILNILRGADHKIQGWRRKIAKNEHRIVTPFPILKFNWWWAGMASVSNFTRVYLARGGNTMWNWWCQFVQNYNTRYDPEIQFLGLEFHEPFS